MRFFSQESPILLLSRVALAFSWVYQGAVPKIVCQSRGEIQLLGHLIPPGIVCETVLWMGVAEIFFGFFLLVARWHWVFWLNIVSLVGLLCFVALFEPAMLALPFNPLTLNVALLALSVIALLELKKSQTLT